MKSWNNKTEPQQEAFKFKSIFCSRSWKVKSNFIGKWTSTINIIIVKTNIINILKIATQDKHPSWDVYKNTKNNSPNNVEFWRTVTFIATLFILTHIKWALRPKFFTRFTCKSKTNFSMILNQCHLE